VDEAQVPNRPVSVMKTVLTAGGASVVGGLVLMLLCLVGLTATDTSIRYPGEVQSQLGLRVVGVVPRLGS
jgi:capsular polysaccharide biosynthesis protein